MSDQPPVYTADMGEVLYDPPRTVIIAGKPRHPIAYCNPRVERTYIATDAIDEGNRRHAEEHAKKPDPWADFGRADDG